ncbi:MAG: ester cyclase [Chloroflexia bacterium]|nr:ester cyclase [Chloroflexia bacterium]
MAVGLPQSRQAGGFRAYARSGTSRTTHEPAGSTRCAQPGSTTPSQYRCGTYQGGIPGSSPSAVGQPVEYEGVDVFRIEEGKIAEYWLSADILQLLQEIGVIPS